MTRLTRSCRLIVPIAIVALAIVTSACHHGNKPADVPTGNTPADQFLFQRGNDSMKKERWLDARKYYQQIVDNYPQSPLRPDAKLGVGDSYLAEGGEANLVLAENEYKEFITFYPTSTRVDYAQYAARHDALQSHAQAGTGSDGNQGGHAAHSGVLRPLSEQHAPAGGPHEMPRSAEPAQ